MKTAAIICEYNPFHNGHKFQIDTARQLTGCDCIVGLMSGNYVQRGDFAIFPKDVRAKMAIEGGVDLVLENSSYCVLRSAEGYAHSAVYALDALGCIDFLVFGAESDDFEQLYKIADFLACESSEYKRLLNYKISDGTSFAAARSYAVSSIFGDEADAVIKKPNNLLAIEYIKAIIRLKSNIKPILIQRKGVGHNDIKASGGFASATYIRECILSKSDFSSYVPANDSLYNRKSFNYSLSDSALISSLCLKNKEDLKEISGISEGLENKIKKEIFSCDTIDELTEKVKSKRYAYTRIRRALLCAYLNITEDEASMPLEYLKILEFNDTGRSFLNTAKKISKIILAKNAGSVLKDKTALKQWKKELERDRVYEILYSACK